MMFSFLSTPRVILSARVPNVVEECWIQYLQPQDTKSNELRICYTRDSAVYHEEQENDVEEWRRRCCSMYSKGMLSHNQCQTHLRQRSDVTIDPTYSMRVLVTRVPKRSKRATCDSKVRVMGLGHSAYTSHMRRTLFTFSLCKI